MEITFQLSEEPFVILFGADSVANARKGFVHLLRALEHVKSAVAGGAVSGVV